MIFPSLTGFEAWIRNTRIRAHMRVERLWHALKGNRNSVPRVAEANLCGVLAAYWNVDALCVRMLGCTLRTYMHVHIHAHISICILHAACLPIAGVRICTLLCKKHSYSICQRAEHADACSGLCK